MSQSGGNFLDSLLLSRATISVTGSGLVRQVAGVTQGAAVQVTTGDFDPSAVVVVSAVNAGTVAVERQIDSASSTIPSGGAFIEKAGKIALASTSALSTVLYPSGISLVGAGANATTTVVTQGLVDPAIINLGAGVACAVGLNSSGVPVRVTDAACVSGRKYLGSCDVNGAIYVSPFNDDRFTVTNYGAVADADGAGAGTDLGAVLTLLLGIVGANRGPEIYIPDGRFRMATNVSITHSVIIGGAGGGVFYAPTQLFLDPGVTGFFSPYASSGQTSTLKDFWIGAVSNDATATTGSWTASTRQIVVADATSFSVGQVIALAGVGGLTILPYVLGTVTSGSNQVTLSEENGYGLKVGHMITLGTAYPLATKITAIDKSVPTAWVLTMASNAAASVTSGQVNYCFDLIAKIVSASGTTFTLDSAGSINGSGAIPATATNVPVTHADCAVYTQTQLNIDDVYAGGGSSGTYGLAGAAFAFCGETDDVPQGNTDGARVTGGYVLNCRHAIYTRGDAANIGRFIGITASECTDWAFREGGELGNVYVGCHSDGGLGYITTQSAANGSTFLHCYCEGGTMQALGNGAQWYGGTGAYDPGGTSTVGGRTNKSYHESNDTTAILEVAISDFNNSTSDFLRMWTPDNATFPWAVRQTQTNVDGFTGWWGLTSTKGTRSYAFLVPGIGTTYYADGAPIIWFPGGIRIGGPNATVSASVLILTGAGSPESAVTAPVGSLYTRNDGGASTTLYVKESGSGNTGWIAK